MIYVGVEIGGTKTQLMAGDDEGRVLERRRFEVERELGAEGIRGCLEAEVPRLVRDFGAVGVGVGYGGPVDWRTGRIAKSFHVSGWDGFPLGDWLSELCGVAAAVDNDANVACLGEAVFGAGRGVDSVAWVNMGSGVGGGLVRGGRIFHGQVPGEMEIGHLRLDVSGRIVEDICSGWALDRQVREEVAFRPDSILASVVLKRGGNGGEAGCLAGAVAAGCLRAKAIVEEAMRGLAFALSHVVHLVHPELIVVGGGVSQMGEIVLEPLRRKLPGFLMEPFRPGPRVVGVGLGTESVTFGGLALAAMRGRIRE
ncbi:MAG: hypothetical protein RIS92_3224 [Verrucomicrobiota bacterium]